MIFKKLLVIFLSLIIVTNDLMATVSVEPFPRHVDLGADIKNGMTPSDLPVAGYDDFFNREVFNIAENLNLSSYSGMKPFVGYGIYQESPASCQYIEVPGKEKRDFDQVFHKYYVFNGKSYGLSSNTMNYNDCKNLATAYGGNVAAIDEGSENMAISGFSEENFWVGATISSCSDYDYTSSINKTQFFYNWENIDTVGYCVDSKKNIKSSNRGKWLKVNESEFNKCVVEWDTPVYYRPLKVCAPWWKIIREYDTKTSTLYNQAELNSINQADIPKTMNVCISFNASIAQKLAVAPTRDVTCTSYYAMSPQKPECTHNIKQDQCFVDECGGYIKNVCRLKNEDIVGKGYIKGEIILENGILAEVKIKDDVKTHVFECPPSAPSNKYCEEKAKVTVFPEECPGSQCQELKECILSLNPTQSKESFNRAEEDCRSTYTCEKVYPDLQLPPTLDASGNVISLTGVCSNGSTVDIAPNILDKQRKVCIEYEKHKITDTVSQRCVLDKSYQDFVVNVALSEEDIYQEDPNCLRTDRPDQSQVEEVITLRVQDKDFYKSRISKVFIDGATDLLYDSNQFGNYLLRFFYGSGNSNIDIEIPATESCDLSSSLNTDFSIFNDLIFHDRTKRILYNGTDESLTIDNEINQINIDNLNVIVQGTSTTLDSQRCNNLSNEKGFSTFQDGSVVFNENELGITSCTIPIRKITNPDESGLKYIKSLTSETVMYGFEGTMSKHDCLIKAVQLNGVFNENAFGADWSSTGTCTVTSGEKPERYITYLENYAGCSQPTINLSTGSSCAPLNNSSNTATTINGLTSIIAIEDYMDGVWGYNTNYVTKIPLENKVTLTSSDYANAEAFPLVPISSITDYQKYVSTIDHWASKSKEPNSVSKFLLGVGSLSFDRPNWYFASISLVGIVVIIVVALLTPTEKMNRQNLLWFIYKYTTNSIFGIYDARYSFTTNKSAGGVTIPGNNNQYRIYSDGGYKTSRNKPGSFKTEIQNYKEIKKELLRCVGFEPSVISQTFHRSESDIITGYPSCKWYNPWCEKTSTYQWFHNVNISKAVKNSYFGATQSLVLVLPYIGDFIFTAFDKYDNKLGEVLVSSNEFVNTNSSDMLKFARVSFGPGMNLAENVSNKCLRDNMVEWGGGVSGGYFENSNTSENTGCSKSNDTYVKDHAMTKIEIKPTTMIDQSFVFELTKPLPYANRIFAATLDKKQERNYRCFNDFASCDDDSFKGE